MFGIRQKLFLGFGGLLLISVIIGVQSIRHFNHLGQSIEVILQENYRSVVACQNMKEAIERINSGILLVMMGCTEGNHHIQSGIGKFHAALDVEFTNVTLPGEAEKAAIVQKLFIHYRQLIEQIIHPLKSPDERHGIYFTELLPVFQEIQNTAEDILNMNQNNMNVANVAAKDDAVAARHRMIFFLIACSLIAGTYIYFTNYWILKPIVQLIDSANEIRSGNLDLAIQGRSRDEIGQLSEAFNTMTMSLRQLRRNDQLTLSRSRHVMTEIFKNLPTVIAVLDLEGRVEIATDTAETFFGLKSGVLIQELPFEWIASLVRKSQVEDQIAELKGNDNFKQHFIENQEYFFQPMALPIRDAEGRQTGTVLILKDVTQLQQQAEMKKGVISTVSHQLKSPLTSIQMAIHLLLEEKLGSLSEKQIELLIAARDDSDRLANIIEDLLDISRIESGKVLMEFQTHSPRMIAHEALEPFLTEAKDKGVEISIDISNNVPDVRADQRRINHVFTNLISNALKFTEPGGTITITAVPESESVRFSVIDTGKGIAKEYLHRVFEQFFQIPDQKEKKGVGLGLAIVREIVQAHGGHTGVESQIGKGSVFWFTLPAAFNI